MRGYFHLSLAGKSGIVSIAGCNGSLSRLLTAEKKRRDNGAQNNG